MPPLEPEEASGIITGSEQILKEYASQASLNAKQIVKLIEDVRHNPAFNADEVDTDMLKAFLCFHRKFRFRNHFHAPGRRWSSEI